MAVLEGDDSEFVRVRRRNWARLIRRVWLEDPTLCPYCGKTMKVVAAISSPAQDDVIENLTGQSPAFQLLKHRGDWPVMSSLTGRMHTNLRAKSSSADDWPVNEKILRCLNLWDPPWLRQRRARSPPVLGPPSHPSAEDIPHDAPLAESIDPPHPEDYPDPPSRDDWE